MFWGHSGTTTMLRLSIREIITLITILEGKIPRMGVVRRTREMEFRYITIIFLVMSVLGGKSIF